jgi:transglutaminase-like putative cysteine protease
LTIPASVPAWDSAVHTWEKITKPWRDFTDNMQNAVDALHSSTGGRSGEYFGSQLPLGRGLPLSDAVMFKVQAPTVSPDEKPPRYYWRGRSYDTFLNGQWYSTGTKREEYAPTAVNPFDVSIQNNSKARFIVSLGNTQFSLLYAPSEPVWMSRTGLTFTQVTDTGGGDIIAWHAFPWLQPGEVYQVDSMLSNPDRGQLTDAGINYPEWVKNKYLQLPPSFSPRIERLAQDVTAGAETPFDKATAITDYLRNHIEYEPTIPSLPRNKDSLEWVLFEYKKGFCVYYASAEVLMLRSVGVPARMAVGFAQGEQEGNTYTVRRLNAHAWPEVYFPNIGWVEFEPTGNQPVLDRPLPLLDSLSSNPAEPRNLPREEGLDANTRDPNARIEDITLPGPKLPSPLLYLIPLFLVTIILLFFADRRYSFSKHVPVLMRASFERTGFEVPKWIIHWEYWGRLSPIEKAFESINFGLRMLDEPMPGHKTPIERAQKLLSLMPKMSTQIKVLLDEHQTSLYTSREANVLQARRAAANIRKQVILERLGYLFSRKPLRE